MKSIDVGNGICIGNYESYLKLKKYFSKFIHIIDYPNYNKIDEGIGNFSILNSEKFDTLSIRELDKFASLGGSEDTIFINSEDMDSAAVIATICKTIRNRNVFTSMAEVAHAIFKATDKLPRFEPGQLQPALKYFRKIFVEKPPVSKILKKE